jgi:hypothetical protein
LDKKIRIGTLALLTCNPGFFSPAADTYFSDTFINANVGKNIQGECASKVNQYFTIASYVDWVPDMPGPFTYAVRLHGTGAGTTCNAGWFSYSVPTGKYAKNNSLATSGCKFTSTLDQAAFVKYRKPATSTSTGSNVMATEILSYQ